VLVPLEGVTKLQGPEGDSQSQIMETPWEFIKNATKLGLLIQTGSHVTREFSVSDTPIA
jgi:hypothetical protein